MARFDVHRGNGAIDYYLNVQSEFHDHIATRVVIPLLATHKIPDITRRLHVPVWVDGKPYYLVTPMIAALPMHVLGKPICNLAEHSHDITASIDFLLQGF